MQTLKHAENEEWQMHRTIFDVKEGGECTYVNVLGQKRADGSYAVFVATMDATFKIEPDIFVTR